MTVVVQHGDCREAMAAMPAASFDACVTDPPYELGFMGKSWDNRGVAFDPATWGAVLRVLKPGAHLLAFGGTRTFHRMAVAIEDAGFEIRDCVLWMYGTGFPKSHDVAKALDKAAGAEREVLAKGAPVKRMIPGADQDRTGSWVKDNGREYVPTTTAPATPEAARWQGWDTALKPAWEPIIVARKPLIGTVAENVLAHGTGALNIDGCRVGVEGGTTRGANRSNAGKPRNTLHGGNFGVEELNAGRWPANVIHDGSDEVLDAFAAYGERKSGELHPWHDAKESANGSMTGKNYAGRVKQSFGGDTGTAARFFYSAKASKADRAGSKHPTVKPIALMRYLCRLVTPPGGRILDPFAGSGTTGEAALREGLLATLVEAEADYAADIQRRVLDARIDMLPPGLRELL
jgi:site-specific DNA-methyltransferase (adenine-specific)